MFKDIKSFLKSSDGNGKRKKISPFIIILVAIILIVPTTIALLHTYFFNDSEVIAKTMLSAKLYNADGVSLATEEIDESELDASSIVKIFHGIVTNKASIEAPSELGEYNFKLDFTRNASTEQFFCYFTDSYKTSYLQDSKGAFFSIREADYNLFLNSVFSNSVYPEFHPPKLITGDQEEITPNEAVWYYQKQNQETFLSDAPLEHFTDITYNISGAINLHFYDIPDSCTAQIIDENGETIYEGSLEDLSFVKPQTDTLLRARVSATWDRKDGRTSHGYAIYNFNIVLGNKAEFSVNKTTVTSGDFITISIKNAQSVSQIIYSVKSAAALSEENSASFESLTSYDPIFITDGNSARAIIPFHAQLPSGTFTFSVAYGAAEQEFAIEIQERATADITLPRASNEISSIVSQSSIDEFKNILKNLKSSSQDIRYFRGSFISPLDFGFTAGYSFGDTLNSNDNILRFTADGAEFISSAADKTAVKALNVGVVIEASYSPYLGNYVVIDHGMGLRTWYCGLGDLNVNVGRIVAKGEIVGQIGRYPTASGDGFILMCSIYDTLVSPDVLWSADLNFD